MSPLEAVPLAEFARVDEPGVDALLGAPGDALISQGSDTIVYGDGGAGKTTLLLDLALHLAAGDPWLGVPVSRSSRVLIIENEGPRPQFRIKVRRKLAGWPGSDPGDRLEIVQAAWAEFSFASEQSIADLAEIIERQKIDVVIAGPLARLGMDENGTLQEVVSFMQRVAGLRNRAGRPVAVILVHHSSKSGAVSGAWEGATDTLIHVEKGGIGKTILTVEKARWSPSQHGRKMTLRWTDGEGFEGDAEAAERDLLGELDELQADGEWRDVEEVRTAVKAAKESVRQLLEDHFEMRTKEDAKALGRSPRTKLYGTRLTAESSPVESSRPGAAETHSTTRLDLRESGSSRVGSAPTPNPDQTASRVESARPR